MANALLTQRLTEVQRGIWVPNKNIRVGQLLDLFLADYERNGKSLDWAGIVVGHLRPFFGSMLARRVETNAIAYVGKRRQAGRRNSTINRELSALRRSFRLGKDRRPPLVEVKPRIKNLKEPLARRGFFEFKMFTKLRLELPGYLRPLISFAYNTGVRKGEILQIRCPFRCAPADRSREQVDLMNGIVRLEPGETKNDEPRHVPLVGELREVIRLQIETRDQQCPNCPWLFFRRGQRIKDFRTAWEGACQRAGLWDANRNKHGGPEKLFHDLRRTGARNLVRAGVPERVVQQIAGWKTRSVFDRYNVVSARDFREAGERLERYQQEQQAAYDLAQGKSGASPEKVN